MVMLWWSFGLDSTLTVKGLWKASGPEGPKDGAKIVLFFDICKF